MAYLSDARVRYIVIHYSASAIEVEYPYSRLEADHLARGFREGGYHYYFPRDGGRVAGRDLTKPGRFEMGAHSRGENDASVGLCFEGGLTRANMKTGRDTRTEGQKREMISTIWELKKRFPKAKVVGHRDMPGAATQCPGFDAGAWWASVEAQSTRKTAPTSGTQRGRVPYTGKTLTQKLAGFFEAIVAMLKGWTK